MKQCKRCGERGFEPQDVVFMFDGPEGADLALQEVAHRTSYPDHWPMCDGGRCNELLCPMEVEELCGPIIELGHGGNVVRR